MASGTLTADGSTAWVELPEGECAVVIGGTWGSGTATLQLQTAVDASALAINSAAWTANIVANIRIGAGMKVRITLASSTNPDLDWQIEPLLEPVAILQRVTDCEIC